MSDEKIKHTPGPWTMHDQGSGIEGSRFSVDGQDSLGPWLVMTATRPGDAVLGALAITAPHDCDVPGCPGVENKRRLEYLDQIEAREGRGIDRGKTS